MKGTIKWIGMKILKINMKAKKSMTCSSNWSGFGKQLLLLFPIWDP